MAGAALVLACLTPAWTAAVTAEATSGAKKPATALTAPEIVANYVAA